MTTYSEAEIRERANRAEILLQDDLLAEMLVKVREEARNALEDADPNDTMEILRQQAIAKCTQELFSLMKACIIATGAKDGGVSAENSRQTGGEGRTP